MIVYKATNLLNNKVYIGKTVNVLNKRKLGHERAAQNPKCYFHYALRKYGLKGFIWEILYRCYSTDLLNKKEREFISFYKSNDNRLGYNITTGGTGGDTFSNNPRKEQILAAIKEERNTEVAKLRVSRVHKGKTVSLEVRKSWSEKRRVMVTQCMENIILKKQLKR